MRVKVNTKCSKGIGPAPKSAKFDDPRILHQLKPAGVRQPVAEAWVLLQINAIRLGMAPIGYNVY